MQVKKQLCLFLNRLQVGESIPLPACEQSSERVKMKHFLARLCKLNLGRLSAAHSPATEEGIECLCVLESIFHLIHHCRFGAMIPERQLIFSTYTSTQKI